MLESNSGEFQAMSGQVLIQFTADSAETPKDEDEMSENEGSQQTNLFAAMSTRCQMWLLHFIKNADVLPLCSKERQDYTRQFIALAGSIFDERIQPGERVDTPEMLVNETTVDGKGQFFIYSRGQHA